jgi:hypothetical protein
VNKEIPLHPTKAPVPRGAIIVKKGGTRTYKVIRCQKGACGSCGGTGIVWLVKLKGAYSSFETDGVWVAKNYLRVMPEKGGTDGN